MEAKPEPSNMAEPNEHRFSFGSPARAGGGAGFIFGSPVAGNASGARRAPATSAGGLFGVASTPSSTALVPARGGFSFGTAAPAPASTNGSDAPNAPPPAAGGGFSFSFGAPNRGPAAPAASSIPASAAPTISDGDTQTQEAGVQTHEESFPAVSAQVGAASANGKPRASFAAPISALGGRPNAFDTQTSSNASPGLFASSWTATSAFLPRAASRSDIDYKRLLTKFFNETHPTRSGEVDALLSQYKGNEAELFIELAKQYNRPNALNEVFESRVEETLASLYLQVFHPGSATEAEQILATYKGREAEMFVHLAAKWHTTCNPFERKPAAASFSQMNRGLPSAAVPWDFRPRWNDCPPSSSDDDESAKYETNAIVRFRTPAPSPFGFSPNVLYPPSAAYSSSTVPGQRFNNATFGEFWSSAQTAQPRPPSFSFGGLGRGEYSDFASSRGPRYNSLGFAPGQSTSWTHTVPFAGNSISGFGHDMGTSATLYQPTWKQDGTNEITLQSITAMQQYGHKSFEELRLEDYVSGNKGTAVGGFETSAQPNNASVQPGPPSFSPAAPIFGRGFGVASSRFGSPQRVSQPVQLPQPSFVAETLRYVAPSSLSVIPPNALVAPPLTVDLSEDCVICHEKLSDQECVLADRCKHVFHDACLQQALEVKLQCPICRGQIGVCHGTSPSGTMKTYLHLQTTCAGFPKGSIVIEYSLPCAAQKDYHSNPGELHAAKFARAYLPNTLDAKDLLPRLKYAFMHGLTFSVGTSSSSGRNNIITWDSVPHKTSTDGGHRRRGFPDADYFDDCHDELNCLGVPPFSSLDGSGNELN